MLRTDCSSSEFPFQDEPELKQSDVAPIGDSSTPSILVAEDTEVLTF